MGGPDSFHVQLQGPGIYFGGQVIQGQVLINSCEEMSNVKNVQIKLTGFGEVHWTEQERKTRRSSDGQRDEHYTVTKTFRNHEEYVDNKILVHHGYLPAGQHVFPFSFLLPPNLPSSFEGQHGHVRYFIEAKIDRSGLFSFNKRKKQFITINSVVDLNLIQGADMAQTNSNVKTFGCLCCKSGPLSAMVRIPRYGYTPGEILSISAEIENLSNKKMNCTKARLFQDVVFRATNGTKSSTRILQEVRRGPIKTGETDVWNGQPLSIPAVPPSGLGGCRIIDVSYRLEFLVDPSGIGFNLVVSIPITIGTIPLRSYFQQIAAARPSYPPSSSTMGHSGHQGETKWEPFSDEAAAPPQYQPYNPNQASPSYAQPTYNPTAPPMPPTGYTDLPPPSYADAVAAHEDGRPNQLRSDRDSEHTDANWDFNPRYPVWSMPSAPPQ